MKSMNAEGLALLNSRHKADHPTPAQITAARELCHELPALVRKAIDAGMPKTAQAIQGAVERVGYEMGDMLDKNRR